MKIIEKNDYNHSIKINHRDVKCYDRKMIKELYPSGNYSIVGETFENNEKRVIDTVIIGRKKLNVSKYGKNNKIIYKIKGYFLVGDNQFLVILQNRLLFLLLFASIAIVGIIAIILGVKALKGTPSLVPDYPLPPEDKGSIDIKNDTSKNNYTSRKNHASIKVAREISVDLNKKEVSILYQNFNASNKDAVVSICILKDNDEYVIARSGLVKSGKEIKNIQLLDDAIKITQGVYKGRIKVDFYDETTGEKAATSTDFDDVEITVK